MSLLLRPVSPVVPVVGLLLPVSRDLGSPEPAGSVVDHVQGGRHGPRAVLLPGDHGQHARLRPHVRLELSFFLHLSITHSCPSRLSRYCLFRLANTLLTLLTSGLLQVLAPGPGSHALRRVQLFRAGLGHWVGRHRLGLQWTLWATGTAR